MSLTSGQFHDVDILCQNRKNSCISSRILDQRSMPYGMNMSRLGPQPLEPARSRLERTQSEPPKPSKKDLCRGSQTLSSKCSSQTNNNAQAQDSSTRYKTELCRPFEETGHCRYGSKCQFAHGASELRNLNRHPKYKTELCRTFHSTGFCSYGQRCNFIHNDDDSAAPVPLKPLEIRPQALSLAGSTGESTPESSVSGDSPSSSPGFASHSSTEGVFFNYRDAYAQPQSRYQESAYLTEEYFRAPARTSTSTYAPMNSLNNLTSQFSLFSIGAQ